VKTVAVGVAGSGTSAIGGSISVNTISLNTASNIVNGANVAATANVLVATQADHAIEQSTGAAGFGANGGVGASLVINTVSGSSNAAIEGSGTVVTADAASGVGIKMNDNEFTSIDHIADINSITNYQTLDLKNKRKTLEQETGVAVNASATQKINSIVVNVGGAGSVGIAANVELNRVKGNTEAHIQDAAITTKNNGNVDVRLVI